MSGEDLNICNEGRHWWCHETVVKKKSQELPLIPIPLGSAGYKAFAFSGCRGHAL